MEKYTEKIQSENMKKVAARNIRFYMHLTTLWEYLEKKILPVDEREKMLASFVNLIEQQTNLIEQKGMVCLISKSEWEKELFGKSHSEICECLFDVWTDCFQSPDEMHELMTLLKMDIEAILNDSPE